MYVPCTLYANHGQPEQRGQRMGTGQLALTVGVGEGRSSATLPWALDEPNPVLLMMLIQGKLGGGTPGEPR